MHLLKAAAVGILCTIGTLLGLYLFGFIGILSRKQSSSGSGTGWDPVAAFGLNGLLAVMGFVFLLSFLWFYLRTKAH